MKTSVKRLFCLLLAGLLLGALAGPAAASGSAPAPEGEEAEEVVSVGGAPLHTAALLLVDMDTGEEVFAHNAGTPRTIASLTKIMTYIVTAEAVDDLEGTTMEILEAPLAELEGRGASLSGMKELTGTTMPVLDVLYALMVPSGCDAAAELAWFVTGGDPAAFVKRMNEKAAELGCEDTHFVDSHGLGDGNRSTTRDLYRIARCALEEPRFREVSGSTWHLLPGAEEPIFTTVSIMDRVRGGRYYYPYAHGIKTGYTYAAGRCLVSTAEKGDKRYLCVALGGDIDWESGQANCAMTDSAALYQWAFGENTDTIRPDIPQQMASLQIGESLPLTAEVTENSTGAQPEITWSSSAPEVASVDQTGLVTAHGLGEAVITARSQTGDLDTCTVTAGFYTGIHVNAHVLDTSGETPGYIDWDAVKAAGLDFAILRAGWGSENYPKQNDLSLAVNAAGAEKSGVPYGLSFISYAKSAEGARQEAAYLLRELDEYLPGAEDRLSLPILYDLSEEQFAELPAAQTTQIALAFHDAMAEAGYETVCFWPGTPLDTAALEKAGMELWVSEPSYTADLSQPPDAGGTFPLGWRNRETLYLPQANNKGRAEQSILYMSSARAEKYGAPAVTAAQTGEELRTELQWTAPGCGCTGYEVLRRTGPEGPWETLAQLDKDAVSYADTAVELGQDYTYRVTALTQVPDLLDPDYQARLTGESAPVHIGPDSPSQAAPETPADSGGISWLLPGALALLLLAIALGLLLRVFKRRPKGRRQMR